MMTLKLIFLIYFLTLSSKVVEVKMLIILANDFATMTQYNDFIHAIVSLTLVRLYSVFVSLLFQIKIICRIAYTARINGEWQNQVWALISVTKKKLSFFSRFSSNLLCTAYQFGLRMKAFRIQILIVHSNRL